MKRVFTTTLVASAFAAFAVGVAAQAPQQNPTSQTPSTQTPSSQYPTSSQESGMHRGNRTVTLTGCLREGDTADTFKLDDVQWQGRNGSTEPNESSATESNPSSTESNPTSATGTSGSTSQSATQGNNQSVTLKASADVDLKQHVGHKIQVSGTLSRAVGTTGESNPSMNPPTSTSPSNPTSESTPSSESSMSQHGNRTVNVTSVKMLSETCGG